MRPLTETERDFAEKYHYLVESYIRYRRLDEGEYYDVVIFGYLQAVVNYHERPELKQYAFSTIAQKSMRSAYGNHLKSTRALKRNAFTVSLDAPITDDSENNLHELVADRHDNYEVIFVNETVNHIRQVVPKRQAEILELVSAGYTQTEIAHAKSTTVDKVRQMLWLARKRVCTCNAL